MVADMRIEIRDQQVRDAMERMRLALPLGGDMSPATRSMARVLKTGAQLRFRSMRSPEGVPWAASRRASEEGGQTLSLTRRLRNSITSAYDRNSATVGTNVAYAAIHQFGGIIRAKKGPFLSIPITDAARRAGSPRNMPGLVVLQTLDGQFFLANDKGEAQYLLRRQVVMPERPFLGASAEDKTELLRVLQEHYQATWNR